MTEMTLSPLLLFLILTLTILVVAALYLSLRAKAKSITSNDHIMYTFGILEEMSTRKNNKIIGRCP